MAIHLIGDHERLAFDVQGVRFFGHRISAKEQKHAEAVYTKRGVVDYHGLTDFLLAEHIVDWQGHPDPIELDGEAVPFSVEHLKRLPLDVRNDLIGKLYEASPDTANLGN